MTVPSAARRFLAYHRGRSLLCIDDEGDARGAGPQHPDQMELAVSVLESDVKNKLSWQESDDWNFELLPYRDYTAFKKFNLVGGGIRRTYQPVKVDFASLINGAADRFPLDRSEDWQINVHQNRTRALGGKPGPLTPEGVHQDGHEYVMIAILRRNNVAGAETRLWKPGASEPFWTGTLDAGQAVLLDDRTIAHDITDVLSADGGPGHRDIFIVAFSRWKDKWYGEEHDVAVPVRAEANPAPM